LKLSNVKKKGTGLGKGENPLTKMPSVQKVAPYAGSKIFSEGKRSRGKRKKGKDQGGESLTMEEKSQGRGGRTLKKLGKIPPNKATELPKGGGAGKKGRLSYKLIREKRREKCRGTEKSSLTSGLVG